MNPERFLGRDPAPGGLVAVDEGAAAWRETVVLLAEGRGRLDATIVDSAWRGPRAASVVEAVTDLRTRLDVLETAVAEFSTAWQEWRHGLARRQDRTAELVEVVSQLDADDERRSRVDAEVAVLEQEHATAARALATAADVLGQAVGDADESDVATDLRQGLADLDEAVGGWVASSGTRVERAGQAVATVASLTSVVPHLLGADGSDADDAQVRELASASPGSHRLLDALEHPAEQPDPASWPDASFAPSTGPSLADRLRGPSTPSATDEPGGGDA